MPPRPVAQRKNPQPTSRSCQSGTPATTAFVGDLLCTISPFTGRAANPQLQTRGSNKNSDQAMASLSRLHNLQTRLVLPGHGTPWRDGIEAAVASAMRIGCQ
jgi:glyoxylase-like metal-dependent hydrolase (beta-lactamase superfamily II)